MFEFEIQLARQVCDLNTEKWEKPVVVCRGECSIDDYLLRVITDGEGNTWFKIGDTLVQTWNIESIKVKAVTA